MIRTAHITELEAGLLGLKPAEFRKLGQVVVLAGPNGGGKSRYLNLISKCISQGLSTLSTFENLIESGCPLKPLIQGDLERNQEAFRRWVQSHPNNQSRFLYPDLLEREIARWKFPHEFRLTKTNKPVYLNYTELSRSKISNKNTITLAKIEKYRTNSTLTDFSSLYENIYLQTWHTATILYNLNHPNAKPDISTKNSAEKFNGIVKSLIGEEISYKIIDGLVTPILFGRPFSEYELSEGQLILLSWASAINRQAEDLRDAIIFIDEPEVHLHADMCIAALERIRTDIIGENGQLWIATHSPSIIAHFGVDSLYHVKDGSIEYAGAGKVVQVMDSILGGEAGREKLATALLDAEHVAFAKFAAECILPATVAEHQSDDPQAQQLSSALSRRLTKPEATVRVLDYAAGKGRFATALAERCRVVDTDWLNRIEYHAYNDPKHTPNEVADKCKQALGAFCGVESVAERYWDSMADLKAKQAGKIDLVILSNVLHEIDINSWTRVFSEIAKLLSENGSLLVIEDLLPPMGELPNMWGYIILDQCGFEVLFDKVDLIEPGATEKDRLLAIEVSRQNVADVGKEKTEKALTYLRDKSAERISSLRNTDTNKRDHKTGRQHAHYTMLYTSASMALTAIK